MNSLGMSDLKEIAYANQVENWGELSDADSSYESVMSYDFQGGSFSEA